MTITRWSTFACAVFLLTAGLVAPAHGLQRSSPPRPTAAPAVQEPIEQPREPFDRPGRPITRIGQDYALGPHDIVREVVNIVGDVRIDGHVESNVVVIMGSAHLGAGAAVDGNLIVVGGGATIESGASVGSDLVIVGGTLQAPENFVPGGEQVVIGSQWVGHALQNVSPWVTRGLLWGRLIVPDLRWIWIMVGVFFLLYLALNTVFDRPVGAAADVLAARPFGTFFAGMLVLILTVPVLAIMAVSVIGLAVVPFVLCAVIVAGLVGQTAVARAIGRAVVRPEPPEGRIAALAAFVIGFALLCGAYVVPVLGFVTWALTSALGLGAAAVTFRAAWRSERPARRPSAEVPPVPRAAAASIPVDDAGSPLSDVASAALPLLPPDVTAQPVYGGLASYPRATFLDRVAAFALDCLLVAIANALLDLNHHDSFFFLLLLVYHIGFWAWKGTTLGGIVCSLRVIRTHGAELRPVDAVVRGLSSVFSIAALGIGCLWMLQDAESQMWHDKIAGTLVVKLPRDLVLP